LVFLKKVYDSDDEWSFYSVDVEELIVPYNSEKEEEEED